MEENRRLDPNAPLRSKYREKKPFPTAYRRAAFRRWMYDRNLSENTIDGYLYGADAFFRQFEKLSQNALRKFVERLMNDVSVKTVNQRISGLNKYLEFLGKKEWRVKSLKVQKSYALDNVITVEDYEYLKERCKADGNLRWYFMIRFLGATGARISEFLKFTCEGVRQGYLDLYGKGAKRRRIFIPQALRDEALPWIGERRGLLWLSERSREPITSRGVSAGLKKLADKYGVDRECVHPHSFRHLFAKRFLAACNDICLLADLMGHESLETTRLYLRKSTAEQRAIVDDSVTW